MLFDQLKRREFISLLGGAHVRVAAGGARAAANHADSRVRQDHYT
jgi:hypothetical protein